MAAKWEITGRSGGKPDAWQWYPPRRKAGLMPGFPYWIERTRSGKFELSKARDQAGHRYSKMGTYDAVGAAKRAAEAHRLEQIAAAGRKAGKKTAKQRAAWKEDVRAGMRSRRMPAATKPAKKKKAFKRGAKWRSDTEIEISQGTFLGLTKDSGDPYLFNVVGYVGTPAAYEHARAHGLIGPKTASQRALESRFDRPKPKRKRKKVARKRNIGGMSLLTVGLLGVGTYLGYRYLTKDPRRLGPTPRPGPGPGPVIPPPPPPPGVQIPDVAFVGGGETVMTLPSGAEWVVTWDPLSPWRYVAADTETVQAVDSDEGTIRFHVAAQLPTGAVSQVYVQAVDENDDVMGEHKFSVLGP